MAGLMVLLALSLVASPFAEIPSLAAGSLSAAQDAAGKSGSGEAIAAGKSGSEEDAAAVRPGSEETIASGDFGLRSSTAVVLPPKPAHDFLTKPFEEAGKFYHVYKDFVDGDNHFTQKMWVGDTTVDVSEMNEAAAPCQGTSSIQASLDLTKHSWGGYLFTVGVLPAGLNNPILNYGDHNAGADLTGAEKLTFYARGEQGGEQVEFFAGGLGYDEGGNVTHPFPDSTRKISPGYVTLSKDWRRYEIPLQGVNLSRVGAGFGWVTNAARNSGAASVGFYMDEIRYEFADARPRKTPLFLVSYEPRSPLTDDGIINNMAYTYDNAVAAMGLTWLGEHEKARQIADALVYALESDRAYTDGRLRNAYQAGDPRSEPGWFSVLGRPFARLPGFYSQTDQTWYEDGFSVCASTGNVVWAGMALLTVAGDADGAVKEKYLNSARRIAEYLLALKGDASGFPGGYEGWEGSETKAGYLSTEHNIDAISFFRDLSEVEKAGGNTAAAAKYGAASAQAKAFVLSMYDPERGCFYTGTGGAGTGVNRDVLPLDTNTWALLALGDDFADGAKVMDFVEKNLAVDGGYGFSVHASAVPGVWYEGTAQVALAYRQLGNHKKYEAIMAELNRVARTDGSIWSADREGVTTGFSVTGSGIPWVYNKRIHLGAGGWLLFARLGKNPFGADAPGPPAVFHVDSFAVADKTWTGKPIQKGFKIKMYLRGENGALALQNLKENIDYTIVKRGVNRNIGLGSITIKGKLAGLFTGTKKLYFKIIPRKPTGLKLTPGKKSLRVAFRKVSSAQKITTYRVLFRLKGADTWRVRTVKAKWSGAAGKVKTVGVTLKNLKAGKTCEVRVYAYKGKYKGLPTAVKRVKIR